MIHIYSQPKADGVEVAWLRPASAGPERVFSQVFLRVALGLALEPLPFAVVVGLIDKPERQGSARWYWVLDERTTEQPAVLWPELVNLKDQYRVAGLHGPDTPVELAESVRQQEGLSHYRPETRRRPPPALRAQWPSFVDYDLTCGIQLHPVPAPEAVLRELETWLHEDVLHPGTLLPVLGADLQPVPKLNLPGDLPTTETRAGLRQALDAPCLALWYAVRGLERTPAWSPPNKEPEQERRGNSVTGY